MMKKTFLLILLAFAVLAFASCKSENSNQADENPPGFGNGGNDPSEVEISRQIVLADADIDAESLLEALKPYIKDATIVTDDAEASDLELIIGESARSISNSAYRRLEIELDDASGYSGWLIYAKDGSVAVAYSSSIARRFALSALEELCKSGDIFASSDGVLAEDKFNTEARIDETRESEREAGFSVLEVKDFGLFDLRNTI